VLKQFSALASIDDVEVRVVHEQYEARKHTDTQTAASALMGLILATSACPILSRMRPLANTHQPFSTDTEMVYRLASMHLLECFLAGRTPDLREFSDFFAELDKLNAAFAVRIKRVTERGASVNALVVLHARMHGGKHVAGKKAEQNPWEVPARASGALAEKALGYRARIGSRYAMCSRRQ
jgi:hypothetical protein